ncbi:MAG: recombination protein O N-terminal domain-containing protein [bacterium]|nr:recombination protein O N-terminal domain-containing protein [bacterium]MDZ4231450.1 recombination protein O N-terminal domain-containing protein [Patescibacteria group bacterium]
MNEHYTPALVLGIQPRNDKDAQFTLYTKDLGKIYATAKSVRKITSKLAGHLKVGSLADVRIAARGNSFQLIDGLSRGELCQNIEILRFLNFLDSTIPQQQPDQRLWYTVQEAVAGCRLSAPVYKYLLRLMGFVGADTDVITCRGCRKDNEIVYFYAPDIIFLCSRCLSRVRIDKNAAVPVS